MRGVAGNVGSAARPRSARRCARRRAADARLEFGDVATIIPAGCSALDTYRQIRSSEAPPDRDRPGRATRWSHRTERQLCRPSRRQCGRRDHRRSAARDFALLGIQPSGDDHPCCSAAAAPSSRCSSGRRRPAISDWAMAATGCTSTSTHDGWSGSAADRHGRGPFPGLIAPELGSARPGLAASASSPPRAGNGWRGEMVWFQTVNQTPDAVRRRPRDSPRPQRRPRGAGAHRPCGTPSRRPP